jgi:hypothetical protein
MSKSLCLDLPVLTIANAAVPKVLYDMSQPNRERVRLAEAVCVLVSSVRVSVLPA